MRTIVIGDVHGCYEELKTLLSDLEEGGAYNKDTDKLIFLGDYIDRGKDSRLVIELIRSLQKDNDKVIALMGNHEDMLLDYYKGFNNSWLWNGHNETLNSYDGHREQFEDDMKWMRKLPLYHEDENYIYVHAGVDVNKPLKEQDKNTLLWIRDDFIYSEKKYDKKIIFGHTPTMYLSEDGDKPILTFAENIDIDTGCVYNGKLTALIIEDGEVECFYQIDKITEDSLDTLNN